MSTDTGEVIIFRFYDDKDEQGSEVARINASTYKWAPRNAFRQWVRETHPPAGRYAAVFPQGYNYGNGRHAVMNLYRVKYPDVVIVTNGSEETLGYRDAR